MADSKENLNDQTCDIYMWPSEDGVYPRCGQPMPCVSHNHKEHVLLYYKEHVLSMSCPNCGASDGPGGTWLLNGELAYSNGRWPCTTCKYVIPGKYMKQDHFIF